MGLKERRERDREARKSQILAAARKLLLEKGFKVITINQIARTAELGVGTIYFYYESIEDIFASLQEEGLKILYEQIADLGSTGMQPAERLARTADTYLRFSREQENYFDIINYFLSSPQVMLQADRKQRVDLAGSRILGLIGDTIAQGIAAGVFKPVDASRHAVLFWAALHGLVQFKKLQTTVLRGESHGALFQYAVEHLVEGLLARPVKTRPSKRRKAT